MKKLSHFGLNASSQWQATDNQRKSLVILSTKIPLTLKWYRSRKLCQKFASIPRRYWRACTQEEKKWKIHLVHVGVRHHVHLSNDRQQTSPKQNRLFWFEYIIAVHTKKRGVNYSEKITYTSAEKIPKNPKKSQKSQKSQKIPHNPKKIQKHPKSHTPSEGVIYPSQKSSKTCNTWKNNVLFYRNILKYISPNK